jgi:hypothetical protein
LAVPLECAFAPHRSGSPRHWYRPAIEPLPAEPGRLVVCALLGRARRGRGCSTPGDDRLETRVYAVKRYLFRLGHAQRSARFATSIEQLVVGLAPVIGWGAVPRGWAERARFVRAHRKSVQRWLDDLQAAGMVAHEPERDNRGLWWRTQIVLLYAPEATEEELRMARRRARRWRSRERARRRAGRIAPSLGAIRERSAAPSRGRRARIARGRAINAQSARRLAAVEAQIAVGEALRSVCRDLTHPFGAPPTSALKLVSPERSRSSVTPRVEARAAVYAARAPLGDGAVVAETDARVAGAPGRPIATLPPKTAASEESGSLSLEEFNALVERRLTAHRRETRWRRAAVGSQASQRAQEVLTWPVGRVCPLGRLREAWVAQRYGLAMVVESGAWSAGLVGPGLPARVGRAISLYEAFREQRPPDWPASGPAALCALARLGTAERLEGDIAHLLGLAKAMRAVALDRDPDRLRRAQSRAVARQSPPSGRFVFRRGAPRGETAEARRCRVRDAVLLAGQDPAAWPNAALALAHLPALTATAQPRLLGPDRFEELDGLGGRATRYRAELAQGRWTLPPLPPQLTPDQTQTKEPPHR